MSDVLSTIEVPLPEPITMEEIERRRKVVAEILRLRAQIGPVGMTTEELLGEERDEDEADA